MVRPDITGTGECIPSAGQGSNTLSSHAAFCSQQGKSYFLDAALCKPEVFCAGLAGGDGMTHCWKDRNGLVALFWSLLP